MSEVENGIPLDEVLQLVGGLLDTKREERAFARVVTDSRVVGCGDLFLALRGERFDGHDFIAEAVRRGASGVVVERSVEPDLLRGCPAQVIRVPDTLRALGDLAAGRRRKFGVPVAVLTGSNGKTTTKEMAVSILTRQYRCLWSPGNFNNRIGLPLTLLRLGSEHERVILEMGMNEPGEIRTLTTISRPEVGALLNIGPAHLGKFPSLEAIAKAKAEMLEAMPRESLLIYNRDDPKVRSLAELWNGSRTAYGLTEGSEVSARDVRERGWGQRFRLVIRGADYPVEVGVPGAHNILNALAAAALTQALGAGPDAIREGLAGFQGLAGRFVLHKRQGFSLVDDCYNANPKSMQAAFDTFAKMSGGTGRVLVLGDMLELGGASREAHLELGRQAARLSPVLLCLTGEFSAWVARGAREEGLTAEQMVFFDDPSILADRLLGQVQRGEWILVKGSHGMALERVVSALLAGSRPQGGATA